jgi:NADH:ubiquinone oxidoreductase subunit E
MAALDTLKMTEVEQRTVQEIIDRWGRREDCLIEMLHDIQEEFNYLPRDILTEVSRSLEVPLAKIVGIATFYMGFSLTPRGKHRIGVCMGTPCHAKGAPLLVEALERHLGIEEGGTTEDLQFSMETTGCVGTCGLAPVVVVDEDMYGNVTPSQIPRILERYKE